MTRAAPNRWPYREHRTLEQVDADARQHSTVLPRSVNMAVRSAEFVARLHRERAS